MTGAGFGPGKLVAGRPTPDRAVLNDIRMLLMDVDGVLTDGRIWIDGEGREYKSFHVHDAAGLFYWRRSGGLSGMLSGRGGHAVEHRARELNIDEVVLSRVDKAEAFDEILARRKLQAHQVCYIGDDLLDLPVLQQVGFAATVPEARIEVATGAHFVTTRSSGFGAVRDVIEELLRAKGVWDDVLAKGGRP